MKLSPTRIRTAGVLALCGVLLLGLVLRWHHIERKSLWADELFTLGIAYYHPLVPQPGQPWYRATSIYEVRDGDTFLTAKAAEQSPPLQDLLEKASVQWFGPTELGARFPGALASCALLLWFAFFWWRSRDPWERRVLAWSLLLLAFSPGLVAYAKEARAYSLGAALVGMGGLLWMRRWRLGWQALPPPGWGEIALFTLACYAHYNAAALVALLLLPDAVAAIVRRSGAAIARLAVLGLLFAGWVAVNAHTILFTTVGGVKWRHMDQEQLLRAAVQGAAVILHPAWLLLVAAVAIGGAVWRLVQRRPVAGPEQLRMAGVLAAVAVAYLGAAGAMAFLAGMAHPRYYLFVVPLVAVLFAIVLAEIRSVWAVALVGVLFVVLAWRDVRRPSLSSFDEHRAMVKQAVQGSGADTLFLYPWAPNRNLYSLYLERYLGADARSRMVAISDVAQAPEVCARLAGVKHVAVVAHDSGRQFIDAVYAACGERWPQRARYAFVNTTAEHWRQAGP